MKQIGAFSEDMAMSVVFDLVKNNIEDFANDEERDNPRSLKDGRHIGWRGKEGET
jgi:hypothetical protein